MEFEDRYHNGACISDTFKATGHIFGSSWEFVLSIFVSLFFTGIILTIGIVIDTMFQLIFYHCIFIQLSYYLLEQNKMENK